MTGLMPVSIADHFGGLGDPRRAQGIRHQLLDIITIAICAVICGADGWEDMESWGIAKGDWLRTFLALPHGIPSHDTFGRVFARLDPQQFARCFRSWMTAVFERTEGQVVALDGKTLRCSHDAPQGKAAIHMVSAWATENALVLGQIKVDDKSNEITALPALLQLLSLEGCIVTIAAMGCQTAIAQAVLDQEADYVLALKENQGTLYQDVVRAFHEGLHTGFRDVAHAHCQSTTGGHGRLEIRRCWTIYDEEYVRYFRRAEHWPGLRSVVMVEAERWEGEKVARERRFFISSLTGQAEELLRAIRSHWGIENGLHWVLDIAFREDDCRVRQGHADENLAVLRHMALNLLRQETSLKLGVKNKRLRAAWDEGYLRKTLAT
ncbi:MAG: ISAs1 family transposase [Anaerolineae bacterium]